MRRRSSPVLRLMIGLVCCIAFATGPAGSASADGHEAADEITAEEALEVPTDVDDADDIRDDNDPDDVGQEALEGIEPGGPDDPAAPPPGDGGH